ncbi:MAG: sucrase ferredoxin [Moorea sp. SIO3G5]|nr:sucrase ferredoxin [Moorena sp. SIO3G5]
MNTFFCSDHSQHLGEDIIGSGTNYQVYVLVECRQPWLSNAMDSKYIPENLRSLVDEVKHRKLPVRFLLIANNKTLKADQTKLLIYSHNGEARLKGYTKLEFDVTNLGEVAGIVKQFLAGETPNCVTQDSDTRDILVCTHGSRDVCCARYGNPFYCKALATVTELSLSNVRLWKASHFGGHRFAPTAIDFPDGRYYGVLDQDSFKSILIRSGDIECFNRVYRGWGILPTKIQVLERELILRYGWNWFKHKVGGSIIKEDVNQDSIQAEISFEKPNGLIYHCRAELVKDESKTLQLKGSCGAQKESVFVKYTIKNLCLYSELLEILPVYQPQMAS